MRIRTAGDHHPEIFLSHPLTQRRLCLFLRHLLPTPGVGGLDLGLFDRCAVFGNIGSGAGLFPAARARTALQLRQQLAGSVLSYQLDLGGAVDQRNPKAGLFGVRHGSSGHVVDPFDLWYIARFVECTLCFGDLQQSCIHFCLIPRAPGTPRTGKNVTRTGARGNLPW